MAYQFAHAQTFSIKSGGAGIAAEAERKESHSRHVEEPKPPVLVAGVEPIAAWNSVVESHGKARDLYTKKSGVKAERKLRNDAHILIGAVASHPEPTATCDTESPDFKDWLDRSIAFFTAEHGEPLSVVMHLDESHPHIHFLAAPDLENGERMPDVHCGEKAKEKVGGKHAKKHVKDQAWKEAMRRYQDRYQDAVGVYHGLARLGPKRRRLPAGAYQAEQAEAKRQAEQLRKLEDQTQTVTTASDQLDQRELAAAAEQEDLEKRKTEIAARETATAEAWAKIDTATSDLEARERAVSTAQVEAGELENQLGEREKSVSQAQDEVREAENEVSEREAAVNIAQDEVRTANEELNTRRDNLGKTKNKLKDRIANVTEREQKLAGLWGALVSAVTLGRAGTKRRVERAVEAVRAEFKEELAEATQNAEKATQSHEKAIQWLRGKNRLLTEQNMTLSGAASASEKAQRQAKAKADELAGKLEPLEATNADITAARDRLAGLFDDLEAAVNSGDLAEAQDLINPDRSGPQPSI